MIFTSFDFLIFFAGVVTIRFCLRNFSAEKWFLLAASYAFCLSWSTTSALLILLTSVLDYSIGKKLTESTDPSSRKRLLVASLVFNLGLLGFFKYSNFFLENVFAVLNFAGWHVAVPRLDIPLPPGISFFTFASMSYVLDVYYERIPACRSKLDYPLFMTFFPKLLSGPITRGGELLPQLKERVRVTAEDVEVGLCYFMIGAVKKMVVADQVAPHVNLIFSAPSQYDGLTLLMGLLGYAVQIYCDFAGYTDMAIGCARMLGFRLPENFQMPYSSVSITEFWRRWHMTLSRWLRDYLFLPLEIATRDVPNPTFRSAVNLTITMVLCGLWHGASWNFVIFGGIHGLALAVHKVWTKWNPLPPQKLGPLYRATWSVIARFLTLGVVLVGYVFFRSASIHDATLYLGRLFSWAQSGTRLNSPFILAGVVTVVLVHLMVRKDRNLALELPAMSLPTRILGYSSLLVLLVVLAATGASPFIYFRF